MTKHQSISRKAAARKAARKAAARKANAFSAPSKCASPSPEEFWNTLPINGPSVERAKLLGALATHALQKEGLVGGEDEPLAITFDDDTDDIELFYFGSTILTDDTVMGFTLAGKKFNLGFMQMNEGVFCIISEVRGGDASMFANAQKIKMRLATKEPDEPFFS